VEEAVPEQLDPGLVTVTVYVPAPAVMEEVVAPPGDHEKVHVGHGEPFTVTSALNVVVPLQIVGFTGLMDAIILDNTVTVVLAVFVQPPYVTETV
jgi:hypothetical protein